MNVPHYPGLTFATILEQAKLIPEVMTCLPSNKEELMSVGRQYLINVVYSIVGQQFSEWVRQKIDERNLKLQTKEGLIKMDPGVKQAWENSGFVSQ